MACTDVDRLLTEAHEAATAAAQAGSTPYRAYALGLVEAYEALEQAYKLAQRELDPPPRSVLFWALLDAELAYRERAAQMRREAAR